MCTDHRCNSGSFIHASLLGCGGIVSLPRPWGFLGHCIFALACLFRISLHSFKTHSPGVTPSLGELHFCDTVYHIPSSGISSLFSGRLRLLRDNGATQYLVPQHSGWQGALLSVSLHLWAFGPAGGWWGRATLFPYHPSRGQDWYFRRKPQLWFSIQLYWHVLSRYFFQMLPVGCLNPSSRMISNFYCLLRFHPSCHLMRRWHEGALATC